MKNSKAYIWSFVGKFGVQFLNLLANLVLARLLTPDDFGMIGVLTIVIMVANTLSDSGLGGALMLEKELNKKNCGTIFVFNITVSIIIYLVIILSSPYIESFYNIKGLANVSILLGVVFVINAISIVPRSILCYKLMFKEYSLISVAGIFIAAVAAILFAYMGLGVYALVLFQIVNAIITTALFFIATKYKIYFTFDRDCFSRMFKFGIFTTLTSVIDTIYENAIAAIFGKCLNVTEAGYISQAKRLEEAASQSVIQSINNTSYPILAKIKDDKSSFIKEANSLLFNMPLLIGPLLILVSVFSKETILLLFGEKWQPVSAYLSILMIAGVFMMFESINRTFIKSLGEVSRLFRYTILKRLIGISIMVAMGAISISLILYGYVLSSLIAFIINTIVYTQILKIKLKDVLLISIKPLLVLLIFYLIMCCSYCYTETLSFKIVQAFILSLIYYFILLRYLGINLIKLIKKIKTK